jgi:hypothetical protein
MTTPAEPPTEAADAPAEAPKPTFAQPIVATPSRAFFIRRMLVAAVAFLAGLWLLYDGYYGWPAHNRKVDAVVAERQAAEARRADDATKADIAKREKALGDKYTDLSILCQKGLGYPVTLLGLYLFVIFLRESKGELRLENDTLHAPRHPPIPIASITGVNDVRWEHKGVALFDYKLADGTVGRVKVDDFVFDRPPTDAIHDELMAKIPRA